MSTETSPHRISLHVHAISAADDLGFLGQQAVAEAMAEGADYRIVGGNMVRLLKYVYPTPRATTRSTVDADTAVDDIEIISPMVDRLKAQDFEQRGGNLFVKPLDENRRVEVNLLLTHRGPQTRMGVQEVPGVGQVDTLPELVFSMAQPPLTLDMTVDLKDGRTIEYTTLIPSLEAAVVLKAHAWRGRMGAKDLVDLSSLLEIREANQAVPWRLDSRALRATRRDTAHILHQLRSETLARPSGALAGVDRLRTAALIEKHIATLG